MGMLSDIFTRVFPVGHPAHRGAFLLAPGPAAVQGATALPVVDVPKVLSVLERRRPDRLSWQSSIVDLMRLLGLDATIDGKDRLADELRYPGGAGDTTVRDRWLHRRLMQVMAASARSDCLYFFASAANSARPNAVPAISQPPSAASVSSTHVRTAWLGSPAIFATICVKSATTAFWPTRSSTPGGVTTWMRTVRARSLAAVCTVSGAMRCR
jgi:Domain of unknown function (DUF3597)